jgi:hypothetical protein
VWGEGTDDTTSSFSVEDSNNEKMYEIQDDSVHIFSGPTTISDTNLLEFFDRTGASTYAAFGTDTGRTYFNVAGTHDEFELRLTAVRQLHMNSSGLFGVGIDAEASTKFFVNYDGDRVAKFVNTRTGSNNLTYGIQAFVTGSNTQNNIAGYFESSNAGSGVSYSIQAEGDIWQSSGNFRTAGDIQAGVDWTLTSSSNAFTVDGDNGQTQLVTLASSATDVNVTLQNIKEGSTYTLIVVMGTTQRNVVFPSGWWLGSGAFDFSTVAASGRAFVTITRTNNIYNFAAVEMTQVV